MSVPVPTAHSPRQAPPALLLRVEEAADLLCLSRWTVYGLIRQGTLRSVKIGASRRVPASAVADFVSTLDSEESR